MTSWPSGMTIRPLMHPGPTAAYARKFSPFGASWSSTLDLLDKELYALRAQRVVLELDFQECDLRIDGMPRANAKMGTPAVAITFESKHGPLRYATDVFTDWQANVRAIALGLEALRKVDRYGISKRGEQYTGWKALPSAPSGETPEQVFKRHAEVYTGADGIRELYRAALKATHPDGGGNAAAFAEVQAARQQLEAAGAW